MCTDASRHRATRGQSEVGVAVVDDVTRERLPVTWWSGRRKQANDLSVAVSARTSAESTVAPQLDTMGRSEQRWVVVVTGTGALYGW